MKDLFEFKDDKVILKGSFDELRSRGLEVDEHMYYYVNFIGVTFKEIQYGLCCYTDELEAFIQGPYLGEIDRYYERIYIRSEEQLQLFLDLMEIMLKFKNIVG